MTISMYRILAAAAVVATVAADAKPWRERKYRPGCSATSAFDGTALGNGQAFLDVSCDENADDTSPDFCDGTEKYVCIRGDGEGEHDICWDSEADFDTGDTAWMLCATTFVMLQTPATGFAQGGLVRRRNAMSVIGQSFMGVVIGCILWYVAGYSLTFGPSCNGYGCTKEDGSQNIKGFIGDIGTYAFFKDVDAHRCGGGDTIPHMLFAAFQMTFALMVPVLVTGAWAEKFHFMSACLFMVIWPILVYYPTAHWIWGGGFMSGWGDAGVLDYAGGIVIHTSSGVSALVVAMMLTERRDFKKGVDTTSNLPLSLVGVALVWVGWYSFNGGSGLRANGQAIGALFVTQVSACFSALTYVICVKLHTGKIPVTAIASGALAGLAGITPGSGFVLPIAGVPIGICVGLASYWGGVLLKSKVQLDDVLDVTSLQAFPGAVGSILVGFFATSDAFPCELPTYPGKECGRGDNEAYGVFYGGNGELLGHQIAAVLIQIVWSAVGTWGTMVIIKKVHGLEVPAEFEQLGLDLSEHGEKAYDLDNYGDEEATYKAAKLCGAAKAGDLEELQQLVRKYQAHPRDGDVDGRNCLHIAAKAGQAAVVEALITDYSVDVTLTDKDGRTALLEAVEAGHLSCVDHLVAAGASLRSAKNTGFLNAAAAGDARAVNTWLAGGADPNTSDYDKRSVLHLAAKGTSERHNLATALLLNAGADATALDSFGNAPTGGTVQSAKMLADATAQGGVVAGMLDHAGLQATVAQQPPPPPRELAGNADAATMELLSAAGSGDLRAVKRLVKKQRATVLRTQDYDGRNALHLAAEHGRYDVAEYIVKTIAGDPNVLNAADHQQQTPLACAAVNKRARVVELLRRNGAELVAAGGKTGELGATLCGYAAAGDVASISAMVGAGVDVNTTDYDGRTMAHVAAAHNETGVLKLIARSSGRALNINAVDAFGGSPADDASRNGHAEALAVIEKLGGQAGPGFLGRDAAGAPGRAALVQSVAAVKNTQV